jgi:PKD repeat protein
MIAPASGAVGAPIAFTGVFTDPGTADTHTFLWSFGDGVTSTLLSPTHTYAASDVFTVTFTASDDDGGSNSVSTTVNVKHIIYLPLISRNVSGAAQSSSVGQFARRDRAAAFTAGPCTERDRSLCQWE